MLHLIEHNPRKLGIFHNKTNVNLVIMQHKREQKHFMSKYKQSVELKI